MASAVATIADAVTALINAEGDLGSGVTAERVYLPILKLEALDTLTVRVVPRETPREIRSRADLQIDYVVDVGIHKRLSATCRPDSSTGNAELDALLEIAERVADLFTPGVGLGSDPLFAWIATEHVLYSPDHLQQSRVFFSLVSLTFRRK